MNKTAIVLIILFTLWFILRLRHRLYMPKDMVEYFYELTNKTSKVLTEHNIKHVIVCGTLLGAIRHKGFIPWDDDVDIAVLEADYPRMKNIDWKKYGLIPRQLDPQSIGHIVFDDKTKYNDGGKMTCVFLDVFALKPENDKLVYASDHARKTWPKEYLYPNEFHNPVPVQFGPCILPAPNNPINYIERVFGKNWQKPIHRYNTYTYILRPELFFTGLNK